MKTEPRAVLFDFGGVFTFSPFDAVMRFADSVGGDPAQVLSLVFGDYAEDSARHPWHQLERGEMTLEEAREAILAEGRRHRLEVDLFQLLAAMADENTDDRVRESLVTYARDLKRAGVATGCITNNVREFRDAWRTMIPVDELFDFVVDSSEVGVRKPHPDIYRLALSRLPDIPAEHTVFLDDVAPNVEAARRLGMHGIHVEDDLDRVIAELDAWLRRPAAD